MTRYRTSTPFSRMPSTHSSCWIHWFDDWSYLYSCFIFYRNKHISVITARSIQINYTYFHSNETFDAAGLDLNASACDFDDAAVKHLPHFGCAGDRLERHWEDNIARGVLDDAVTYAPVALLLIPNQQNYVAILWIARPNISLLDSVRLNKKHVRKEGSGKTNF